MSALPPDIRDFIVEHFDSAEAVEIVLLLRRSPNTFWSPAAVAQQLGIQEDAAFRKMNTLARTKILSAAEQSSAFRYDAQDEKLAAGIAGLADVYSTRRTSVINAIYSASLERLRSFSNAFKLKSE